MTSYSSCRRRVKIMARAFCLGLLVHTYETHTWFRGRILVSSLDLSTGHEITWGNFSCLPVLLSTSTTRKEVRGIKEV